MTTARSFVAIPFSGPSFFAQLAAPFGAHSFLQYKVVDGAHDNATARAQGEHIINFKMMKHSLPKLLERRLIPHICDNIMARNSVAMLKGLAQYPAGAVDIESIGTSPESHTGTQSDGNGAQ